MASPRGANPVARWVSHNRSLVLLLSLVLLILVFPLSEGTAIDSLIFVTIFTAVLLSAVYEVGFETRYAAIGIVLAVPAFIASWTYAFVPTTGTLVAQAVFLIIFLVYTIALVLKRVFSSLSVEPKEILDAISAYIMAGVCFALIFHLMEMLSPNSFRLTYPEVHFSEFMYLSFATLTTLGYGDVVAVSTLARSLAIVEAMLGVTYVGVLIGMLVGSLGRKAPARAIGAGEAAGQPSACGTVLKLSLFRGRGGVVAFGLAALGIVLLAVGLNLATSTIMVRLGIPFFLDTWATSVAVMLGGLWVGMLAGASYNLVMAFTVWEPSSWVYMFNSMLVAIVTWFFWRRNWIDVRRPGRLLVAGVTAGVLNSVLVFFITGAFGLPRLYEGTKAVYQLFLESMPNESSAWWCTELLEESVDKTITILFAAAVAYLIWTLARGRKTENRATSQAAGPSAPRQ